MVLEVQKQCSTQELVPNTWHIANDRTQLMWETILELHCVEVYTCIVCAKHVKCTITGSIQINANRHLEKPSELKCAN